MDDPLPVGLTEAWKDFFDSERHRLEESGRDSYPVVFAHNLLFPLQRMRETEMMMRLARAYQPTTVMEIGADKGGGIYHWCKCLPSVKNVIACEIRGTPYAKEFERAFPHIKFLWLPVSSMDYADAIRPVQRFLSSDGATVGRGYAPLDCLFIDGDKSHFQTDFHSYHHLMNRDKGIVFLHDVSDPAPGEAWEAILKAGFNRGWVIKDTSEVEPALAKFLPSNAYEGWLRNWKGASCTVGFVPLGEVLGKE